MSGYNGYLKIKTKLDNKGIDKDVSELENKIKKLQEGNLSSEAEGNALQQEIDNYEQLCSEAEEYKQKIKELSNEHEKIRGQLSGRIQGYEAGVTESNYNAIQTKLEQVRQKYNEIEKEIDKQAPKIDKVYGKLDKIKLKQTENNAKISEFKQKIEQVNLDKIQSSLNSVGKNIQNQIGKLGKMAMAVVGIRTAWNAVRSAVNLAAQYNPQIAADFEYMKYVIANAIIPVVQKLVNLLYTVLSYVNAIASAWFGINLFGDSSVKNFQKMKKNAGGTADAAKEIKKSLQGFDEMNVLQDNSGSSTGSSSAGVSPSMDLSGIQGEIPGWLKWIMDNKQLIISTLMGMASAILLIKFGLGGIKALGIGLVVAEIINLIQDVIKFIQDPSFENFMNILIDIAFIVGTIAALLGNWPLVIGAVIALIVMTIIKNWDKIKEILRKSWGLDIYQCC